MYYVCIENNKVCSILNYQPNVPATVTVHEITDTEYATLNNRLHWFNTVTLQVESLPDTELEKENQLALASSLRVFLQETDWKVLRHLRETALGIQTSLSESEYIALEQQRQQTAKQI